MLGETPSPSEVSFGPLGSGFHGWQGLAQLLWSSFSMGLLSEALSQPIFGQAGYPKKWEQFSLQVFARVWPNMKNDFLYNFITLWWMFLNKNIPRKQNCQAQKQSSWIFWPLSAPTFPLCSWKWLERVLYPFTFQSWDLESFSLVP